MYMLRFCLCFYVFSVDFLSTVNRYFIESNRLLMESNPLFVENNPLLVENNPFLVKSNPLLVESNPFLVKSNPLLVESIAMDYGTRQFYHNFDMNGHSYYNNPMSDGYHKLCFTTICSCHHIFWVFYFPVYCVSLMK